MHYLSDLGAAHILLDSGSKVSSQGFNPQEHQSESRAKLQKLDLFESKMHIIVFGTVPRIQDLGDLTQD